MWIYPSIYLIDGQKKLIGQRNFKGECLREPPKEQIDDLGMLKVFVKIESNCH
jgi:hypothetical protein